MDASDDFRALLAAEFAPYERLTHQQLGLLESHYRLLCNWNGKINLCRFRSLRELVELHYCESLYLGLLLPAGSLRIVDVGSGAGFPGVPIAVLRTECFVDLLEADQRKAAFLREAADGIGNIQVSVGRADACTKRYDWVVSRAVRSEDVRRAGLAPNCALLTSGPGGTRTPWGNSRFIEVFHVES